jgi:3-phosphoshikimate 1-carboxyvinyltransferase
MKRIEPIKKPLHGEITVPGDKSIAHRAVIFGSIAGGRTRIYNLSGGEDNSRTVRAFRQLGVEIGRDGDALCVEGKGFAGLRQASEAIDCGNSGTTIRLMSGLLAGLPFHSELDGDASIRQRPMKRVIEPLTRMGAKIRSKAGNGLAPLEIDGGGLHGMHYRMPIASAQVKSAILLAALQAEGETVIEEPQRSRDHTEVMIRGFGGAVGVDGVQITLKGGQHLRGQDVRIPGDISSAAFFLVAAALVPGSDVTVRNVGCNPTRDGIVEVLRAMGAAIELFNERTEGGERVVDIHVTGGPLRGVDVGAEWVARTIDEYPILAIAGAVAEGVTRFVDVKELRVKESDRIAAMSEGLRNLGVNVEEGEDSMTIFGGAKLSGGAVRSFADHRVAMAFAVAGLISRDGIEIDDPRCASISFPTFFDLLEQICLQ